MRTRRPSCLILCFDWRKVYQKAASCCDCCMSGTPQSTDNSIRQACSSDVILCCTRDGCRSRLAEGEHVTTSGLDESGRTGACGDSLDPGQSRSANPKSPLSGPPLMGSRIPGGHAEPRIASHEEDVASSEAEAMLSVEFFRERLQRRQVVPKMVRSTCSSLLHHIEALFGAALTRYCWWPSSLGIASHVRQSV